MKLYILMLDHLQHTYLYTQALIISIVFPFSHISNQSMFKNMYKYLMLKNLLNITFFSKIYYQDIDLYTCSYFQIIKLSHSMVMLQDKLIHIIFMYLKYSNRMFRFDHIVSYILQTNLQRMGMNLHINTNFDLIIGSTIRKYMSHTSQYSKIFRLRMSNMFTNIFLLGNLYLNNQKQENQKYNQFSILS